jgi:lipopolysaccharide/colanic/teichoic acid biosynthesis glycosyltransferase
MKRIFDLTASLVTLALSLPLWPFIALAIKLDTRGPVFYTQKRMGRSGRIFHLIKFRSMVTNAEENGAVWSQADDPRITRAGRVMRRFHLDELPQLLNVIKGDMSLVGPRPERQELIKKIALRIPDFDRRHEVKPGITGWAQVNFPYAASLEDSRKKLEYDLDYIRRRGFIFDMKILLKTVKKLFVGPGD